MADLERNAKFYSELKQTNEDLLVVFEGSHRKSPYFDYSETFKDYIKLIDELHKKYPIKTEEIIYNKSASNDISPTITANNVGGQSLFSNSIVNHNATTNNISFNATTSNNMPAIHNQSEIGSQSGIPDSTGTEVDGDEADGNDAPPQPNLDMFEEPDYKYKTRCKVYLKILSGGGSNQAQLMGCGTLYIKNLDAPSKLHLIIRKDPDLRTILLNQVITSTTPLKLLPNKAVTIISRNSDGTAQCYIVKVRDDQVSSELYGQLQSVKNM